MYRKTFCGRWGHFLGSFLITIVGVLFFASVAMADTLYLQENVPFSKDAGVTQAVQNECTLSTRLPGFVEEAAKEHFSKIETFKKAPKTGKVLTMEITDVIGTAGGAWSGSKAVTIKGSLTNNGKKVGSFKARRYSSGGAFGGYKGTCAILGRCIKTLGKDVATWLSAPAEGAALGDL